MQEFVENFMNQEELLEARANKEEAQRILELGYIQLQRCRPFYGTILSSMPCIEATAWLSTIATDGRRLYYSVEFIAGMTQKRRDMVFSRIDNLPGASATKKQALKDRIDLWFRPKTPREIVFLLQHEIRHCMNNHIFRGKGYAHADFNRAADHGINTSLVFEHSVDDPVLGPAWFPNKEKTVFDPEKEFGFMHMGCCDFKYLNWATEDIYRDIRKPSNGKNPGRDPGAGVPIRSTGGGDSYDVHMPDEDDKEALSEADKRTNDNDDDVEPSDLEGVLGTDEKERPVRTEEQKKEDESIMRRTVEVATLNAGSEAPKEARDWLEDGTVPKVNYLTFIRKTIVSLIKGSYSYRRPHRKSAAITNNLHRSGLLPRSRSLILPSRQKEKTIKVFIGFDVSGSFSDSLLRHVRSEVAGLMNQYACFEVVLFCWSTRVGNVVRYNKANCREVNDYKITTTGGTDVFCVFEMLDELKEDVDQLIIFTDGEFLSPAQHLDWRKKYASTLWVRMGGKRGWVQPFGKLVKFEEYI